ncbi:efflux RND transporter periplasmic adaptor subunit [Hyalangium gracile]|uniref:efflux RND transporter periplasmic adaptor subunit n=1 Tax=Hyalangium gracile TaxID=394092 RepID=UPI001CCD5F07|nr:efflux RND transporter periplasmic adaptor subunit [Hyalangium gracile]
MARRAVFSRLVKWGRRHPLGAGVLAVVVLLAGVGAVRSARGAEVEALRVTWGPVVHRIVVSGRVSPPSQVSVASVLAGTVEAVAVEEGAQVEPGQLLLKLEASTLEADVARARAGVGQARARLKQFLEVSAPQRAQAVRQAEVERDQAERAFERTRTLVEAGSVTQEQFEQARSGLELARSRLASAQAQATASVRGGAEVWLVEAGVAQAEAELKAAQERLAQATLAAPVRAVVLRRDVEPGDSVQPGRVLLTLARVGETRLVVEPDERSLAFIQRGQPARASADAFPQERFPATVETVAPAVDAERGTVEVKLAVPKPPDYLRPGMTVSVELEVGRRERALVLPAEAVRDTASEQPWVLVPEGGRAVRRDVELGLRGEDRVEVAKGLAEGELVLLPAGRPLVPGQRVRPRVREGR